MPLQTESMSELGTDWHRQPTSVSVRQFSSAAHSGSVVMSQRHAHEQPVHELPVHQPQKQQGVKEC